MRKIETKKAPGAIGPYSQAFETNGFVITSGQIPVDPQTGLVPDGIEKQAHQSCKNVAAIQVVLTTFSRLVPAASNIPKRDCEK